MLVHTNSQVSHCTQRSELRSNCENHCGTGWLAQGQIKEVRFMLGTVLAKNINMRSNLYLGESQSPFE